MIDSNVNGEGHILRDDHLVIYNQMLVVSSASQSHLKEKCLLIASNYCKCQETDSLIKQKMDVGI